ncbi:GNAT family N-acetyltransferase [Rhodoligotrophos defluvii]|uniref:GNAT family N-acetyltransferase n=1 Tax=Rhodoligotrophos defluvii TaxID=2561934 RepID=UPI0010C9B926|nr:GNAT family N-acetyltransferase [Rhodoligotrophos defluvii]
MRLVPITLSEIDRIEPLWLMLHAHHQTVAPELAPYVSAADSWAQRRSQYEVALSNGGICFLVERAGEDIAYAMAALRPEYRPATFATDGQIGELLTLMVRPGHRGQRIGEMLYGAIAEALRAAGARHQLVGAIPANQGAVRFYIRQGFAQAWLTLTRFGRMPGGPAAGLGTMAKPVKPAEVDQLEPLWLTLHHHHQSVAPALGPFVRDAASWAVIRKLFLEASERELLLRIDEARQLVALACTVVSEDREDLADTWQTGRQVAEIKILVTAAHMRGRGLGSELLHDVQRRLSARGIHDLMIGAIHANHRAVQLYQRHGFRPAWTEMIRFPR